VPVLNPRERLVVGIGTIVTLIVGTHLLLAEPLMTRARNAEAALSVREAMLERRRLLIAQRSRLSEELAAVRARLEVASARLLRGPTPPLAAAELQKLVKDQLADSNIEVRSERVRPPADQQGLQRVAIELTVVGTIRDTVGALARLERSDRLLALMEIQVRLGAVAQPRELLTTLTVAGYLLPGPPTRARVQASAAGAED
jgi:type II secretory pathway component PulM